MIGIKRLLPFYKKKLIQLRKQYASFKLPDYHFVDHEILVFTKSFNDETILTLMNVGPQKNQSIRLH